MAKTFIDKCRILYIMDYLQKHTHEDNPVGAAGLIRMLEAKYGITCDRKTVYSDISALQEYGMDIISVPGRNGGFYVVSRNFESYELKLLIDAVLSSRYLTEKKSRELVEKLCTLCNEQDAALMRRNILVSGRVKSMNETIYFTVDAIQEAITKGQQIRFRYFDWDLGGKRKYRDKEYRASPYGLCQDNENCYLLAWSERHGITSYRLDRMTDVQLADEKRIPCPELSGKALVSHANRLFQMYSGDQTTVKMRFHKSLINVIIDRFGNEVMLIPDGDEHFCFTAPVAVSPMFLSWIIGFGNKAAILHPKSVADQCLQLCREAMQQYPEP